MESKQKHIPESLMAKIFLPLPVKTLLRSRCVCKYWNQVISSKSFIKSHHTHHKNSLDHDTNKYLLLGCSTSYLTCLVDIESYNNILESHEYDLHDICGRNLANHHPLEIYGVCNGLICLSHVKQDLYPDYPIFLWNPVVRKAKKLPSLDIELECIDHSYLCFGYDNIDDDYKVINVVPQRGVYHVYVYSLSTDSWKFLKFYDKNNDIHGFYIWPYPKARFVNGAAYFLQKEEIVSFDLSCEIIRRIILPDGFNSSVDFILEECRDSIALLQNTYGDVVIWVLRVSNNFIVWDKMFAFDFSMPNEYDVLPKGFLNKDKVVLKIRSNRNHLSSKTIGDKYFIYDLENSSQQPFTTPEKVDAMDHGCPGRIYELTESLVLLAETSTPCQKMQLCSTDEQNQKLTNGKRHAWKQS